MHAHEMVYVTQKTWHSRLRPLQKAKCSVRCAKDVVQRGSCGVHARAWRDTYAYRHETTHSRATWARNSDLLCICPCTHQGRCETGGHESCHEEHGDEAFWESILFAIKRVHVWAL